MRAATAILVALVLLVLGRPTRADEQAFVLIVNPKNGIDAVDRELVRDAYLKKRNEWGDGSVVLPISLDPKLGVSHEFVREVLHKTPSQLRSYWSQQIFSGKGTPPPQASSAEAAIEYVLAHPGAIGYIPADVSPGGARVVPLR